jgi:hypothetical protein
LSSDRDASGLLTAGVSSTSRSFESDAAMAIMLTVAASANANELLSIAEDP